jgi:hypothetical protein
MQWHPIPGHQNYEITACGLVRSLDRYIWRRGKHALLKGKLVPPYLTGSGYEAVRLGPGKRGYIHRLLAKTFFGEPPTPDHQVNHKDGNKRNNGISNLEWVSRSENQRHSVTTRLACLGERHHATKITEQQALYIMQSAEPVKVLAAKFGMTGRGIRRLRDGTRWRWLYEENSSPPQ